MVIFLVGLVSMILMRTLRKDYARYSKEEEMDDMVRSALAINFISGLTISLCIHWVSCNWMAFFSCQKTPRGCFESVTGFLYNMLLGCNPEFCVVVVVLVFVSPFRLNEIYFEYMHACASLERILEAGRKSNRSYCILHSSCIFFHFSLQCIRSSGKVIRLQLFY